MMRSLWGLLLLFTLAGQAWSEEALPNPERVKQVRSMYRKLPGEMLALHEPIVVVDVTFTRIPLAAIVEVKDAKGKSLFIRRDNGLDTTTPNAILLSRVAPFKQEVRLAKRGPEEAAVYGLLLRWEEQELKKEYDDRLDRWTMEDVHQFLARFDSLYAGDPPVDVPDRQR